MCYVSLHRRRHWKKMKNKIKNWGTLPIEKILPIEKSKATEKTNCFAKQPKIKAKQINNKNEKYLVTDEANDCGV